MSALDAVAQNPTLAMVALGGGLYLLKELWGWRARAFAKTETTVGVLELGMVEVKAKLGEHTSALATLAQVDAQTRDKLQGLQDFWARQFEALRDEVRRDNKELAALVTDQLTAHRATVHQRLNEAATAQAQTVLDMFERIEALIHERKG